MPILDLSQINMGQIIYKSATKLDLPAIIGLLADENGDRADISAEQFLIAKSNNEIIGCVRIKTLENNTAELASLVVEKKYRGQGIGKQLVAEILERYEKRPVFLLCDRNNAGFYEKNNFQISDADELPEDLKKLYQKILNMPFAKDMKVSTMIHR